MDEQKFQDEIIEKTLPEDSGLINDSNFEKMMIIFFILTDKYSFIEIDNQYMEINIVNKSYFT